MPTLEIAHVNKQGVDLIIVPLSRDFDLKSDADKDAAVDEIQYAAASAGLGGTVVPVWPKHNNRMAFIAPTQWHPFFRSIDLRWIRANLNRRLSW